MFETFCILTAIYVIGVFICSAFKSGAEAAGNAANGNSRKELKDITLSNMHAEKGRHFVISAQVEYIGEKPLFYHAYVLNVNKGEKEYLFATSKENLEREVDKAYRRFGD